MSTRSEALARARAALKQADRFTLYDPANTDIESQVDRSNTAIIQTVLAVSALVDAIGAEEEQPEPASEWRRELTREAWCITLNGQWFGWIDHDRQASDMPWQASQHNRFQSFATEAEALAWLGVPADVAKGWTA